MLSLEARRSKIPKDDLLKNTIFIAFRDVHQELWNQIGQSGMLVCVPHTLSIISRKDQQDNFLVLDERFLLVHTLQIANYVPGIGSDPLFKYYSNLKGQRLKYSAMTNTVETISGFEQDRMCIIVEEIVIYDDLLRKIVVWVIDKPFIGAFRDILSSKDNVQICNFDGESQGQDGAKFLGKSVEYFQEVLGDSACENIKRQFQQFIDSYVFVKGYSKFTIDYLNQLRREVIDWNESTDIESKFKYACSLEYIQILLYPKLFRESCDQYLHKDELLLDLLSKHCDQLFSYKSLGIREELHFIPERSITKMRDINLAFTPISKMHLIASVHSILMEEIESHASKLKKRRQIEEIELDRASNLELILESQSKVNFEITTDDLIPFFMLIISRAGIQNLKANVRYMDLYRGLDELSHYSSFVNISKLEFFFSVYKSSVDALEKDVKPLMKKTMSSVDLKSQMKISTANIFSRSSTFSSKPIQLESPTSLYSSFASISTTQSFSIQDAKARDRPFVPERTESINEITLEEKTDSKHPSFDSTASDVSTPVEEKSEKDLGDFLFSLRNLRNGFSGRL